MTEYLLSNFGQAELLSPIGIGDTTLEIEAAVAGRFPIPIGDQAFAIILWDGSGNEEIVYCTDNPVDGTLEVLRGREGTAARGWFAGTFLRHFITAGTITNLLQTGFISGNQATEAEAEAGIAINKLMTPANTTVHFNARTTEFSRELILSDDAAAARRALGWESAAFSGTGLETTFVLPDAGYDTPYTRVYVDETYQTSGYTITGATLEFDTPPSSGTDNIVVVLGESFAFSVSFPGNNTVSADAIIDGAVTTAKLASGAVTTTKLGNNAASYAKIQQVSDTDKVLGRASAGAGNVEEIPFTAFARAVSALTSIAQAQGYLSSSGWPVPTGAILPFMQLTAPSGWIKLNGGTIGSVSSGATTRANADTAALFTLHWADSSNTDFPIQDSSGAPTTRGASAEADFAANKRLPIPELRGEFIRGLDDSRGIDTGRVLGVAQADLVKAHTHTGTAESTGSAHQHTYGPAAARYGLNDANPGSFRPSGADSTGGGSHTLTTNSGEGAHTHTLAIAANVGAENRPRNVAFLYCVKL